MALIRFSNLVNDIRGATGGNVFARNRSGAYVRNRTSPLNPQSTGQSAVRALLAALSQAWRGLTAAQRESWNGIVDQYPYTNKLGEQRTYSGEQLYVKLNRNLQSAGEDTLSAPLAPQDTTGIEELTADIQDDDTISVSGTLSGVDTDMVMVIQASAPQSAGKNFLGRSKFVNLVASAASGLGAGVDISTEYVARFGSLADAAGSKVFVRAYIVNSNTGQASAPAKIGEIVAEAV